MDTIRHTPDQTVDDNSTRNDGHERAKVSDAYEAYVSDQADENYERLYLAVREYAFCIANAVVPEEHWRRHASLNAATSTLLELEKFDPQRASFSTWAYMSLKRDLIDWRRKRERRHEDSITALSEPYVAMLGWNNSWTDTFGAVEDKIFLKKFLSTLTDEEQLLCQEMAIGAQLSSMASVLGVSLATVKRRWDVIREKARAVRVL